LNDLARKRATRTSPELRQAQLLACAMKVFARLGIGRAVHADVAREARVSVPTVFSYFPTGDALKIAVVTEIDRFLVLLAHSGHGGQWFR
jgi:TetR/AcrR family hemagglutinin/protease transcriptional regulator